EVSGCDPANEGVVELRPPHGVGGLPQLVGKPHAAVRLTSGVVTRTSSPSQAGLDRLHRAMAARVAKGALPGMVTLIAQGDEVHVDAIGTMAFDSDKPMKRDTIFRLASLTKPILATATMMLMEDGTLAL